MWSDITAKTFESASEGYRFSFGSTLESLASPLPELFESNVSQYSFSSSFSTHSGPEVPFIIRYIWLTGGLDCRGAETENEDSFITVSQRGRLSSIISLAGTVLLSLSHAQRVTDTPTSSPQKKKKKVSATRQGLEAIKNSGKKMMTGLFKYFDQSGREEYEEQVKRDREVFRLKRDERVEKEEKAALASKLETRERAKLRKQKSRAKKREAEIRGGERSPPIQRIDVDLQPPPSQKSKTTIAELSRPQRAFKEKHRTKYKKAPGRKRKHEPRSAKYHNWHTPFLWTQIESAAREVGFAGLRRSTVYDWIDYSGDRPKWKDWVIEKAERGNDPFGSPNIRTSLLRSKTG